VDERDAESIDQGIEPRPQEAAKASEMAGEEIDRLGDPLATGEERQLRKQRLIKGPQEFRDIRSNRAKIKPGFPELLPNWSECSRSSGLPARQTRGSRVHLIATVRVEEDLVDQLFNSSEKRLACALLLSANFGTEGKQQPLIAKVSQERADMIGTTRLGGPGLIVRRSICGLI
jgi:hypothetical protein